MTPDLTSLSDEEATEYVHDLLSQLTTARATVEQAERRAAGVRKMIDAMVEMFPALEDELPEDLDEDSPRPRGAEAVRRILDDLEPNEGLSVAAIVVRLDRAGWLPNSSNPANAVRTAVERLVDQKIAKKTKGDSGSVIYRLAASSRRAPAPYDPQEEPF